MSLLLLGTASAAAQVPRVGGRVLQVADRDTVPVVGAWVVLHRVDSVGGEPVDSVRTDGDGRYAIPTARDDSLALFIPAIEHLEIAYFGTAMRAPGRSVVDTSETIFVYDTTSVGPPLVLAEKHFVFRETDPDGSRPVLELLVIENRTSKVRISDGVTPVWTGALPRSAFGLEVAPSDLSPEAIRVDTGEVAVFAPIPPGQKQLVYGYSLPAGTDAVTLPIDQSIDRIQLLLSDTTAAVESDFVFSEGNASVEQFRFARWEGTAADAGPGLEIRFAQAPLAVEDLWWVLILLSAVGFALALAFALRRPQTVAVSADPQVLAARIAELDQVIERGSTPELRRERDELRTQLAAALARRKPSG